MQRFPHSRPEDAELNPQFEDADVETFIKI
jgi:hypothetical protein